MAKLFPSSSVEAAILNRRIGSYQRMVTVVDVAAVIPATPGVIIIDEEVNLAVWGLVATTNREGNFGIIIEKPDGGGWVATNEEGIYFNPQDLLVTLPSLPGQPSPDPNGYEIETSIIPSPMKLSKLPGGPPVPLYKYTLERGQDPGRDWYVDSGAHPAFWTSDHLPKEPRAEDRLTRVRIVIKRSPRVYSSEEQTVIDSYGYRARAVLEIRNQVVWEKEVPIPASGNSMIMDEALDLAEFGLLSDHDRFRFVAEMRRDGKTIRSYLPSDYVVGEELDPPGPTVVWVPRPIFKNTPWWNTQNAGSAYALNKGYEFNRGLAHCSESTRQSIRVVAWRLEPMATTYYDGTPGEAVMDLSTLNPAMGAEIVVLGGPEPQTWNVKFDSSLESPVAHVALGRLVYARVTPDAGGITVQCHPTLTTLQDVFDVINTPEQQNTERFFIPHIFARTLLTPNYVLTGADLTREFSLVAQATPIPVPGGAETGCTFRVRLLIPAPNKIGEWPFIETEGTDDLGAAQLLLRSITPTARYPLGRNIDDSTYGGPVGLFFSDARLRVGDQSVAYTGDAPFVSEEVTGTGFPQTFPHGREAVLAVPVVPSRIRVIPTKWPGGSACDFSYSADNTYVTVTMTAGVSYIVMAWK
jgi:hypothetical protein